MREWLTVALFILLHLALLVAWLVVATLIVVWVLRAVGAIA